MKKQFLLAVLVSFAVQHHALAVENVTKDLGTEAPKIEFITPSAIQAKPVGRIERWHDELVTWGKEHPKKWATIKFSAHTGLFLLSCGAAIGNILRY